MDRIFHSPPIFFFFFFNDTATTEIYTLSLHDALPIFARGIAGHGDYTRVDSQQSQGGRSWENRWTISMGDRKSTRLNSSHSQISYAVFCLKKKKNKIYKMVE